MEGFEAPRPELIHPEEMGGDTVVQFERVGIDIVERLHELGIADATPLQSELQVVGSAVAAQPREMTLPAKLLAGEVERQAHELLGMFEDNATPPWSPEQGVSVSVTQQEGSPLFSLLIQRPRD
ncbi:MAG: hypothetical protein AAB701_01955 [Patescibacteria group bacterium]